MTIVSAAHNRRLVVFVERLTAGFRSAAARGVLRCPLRASRRRRRCRRVEQLMTRAARVCSATAAAACGRVAAARALPRPRLHTKRLVEFAAAVQTDRLFAAVVLPSMMMVGERPRFDLC